MAIKIKNVFKLVLGVAWILPHIALATGYSAGTHRIIPGHFNNDEHLDLLFQGKDSTQPHSILYGDGMGNFANEHEWPNDHAGLNWDQGAHILHTGDFDQDGYTDVFLQSHGHNNTGVVITDEEEGYPNLNQNTWNDPYLDFNWNTRQHKAIIGDFDGDARSDVLLQARYKNHDNAIVLSDTTNSPSYIQQQWSNDYLGLEWDATTHVVHTGDFNNDGRTDIFLQAKYLYDIVFNVLDDDMPLPIPKFPESGHALLLANSLGQFDVVHQQWNNEYLDISWMAEDANVIVGDYNGDGYDDIILQAKRPSREHYLLFNNQEGQFTTIDQVWQDSHLDLNWPGTHKDITVGDINGDGREDLILQARNSNAINIAVAADSQGQFSTDSSIYYDIDYLHATYADPEPLPPSSVAVGTINGRFAVGNNGAANYSIPIAVPPGIAGMEPDLALSFASQGANGLLGMDWSLSGLSTISRCAKTYAQDGTRGTINFDQHDRFCMDGQRLLLVSGSYGGNGSTYRTERDVFSRITANTNSSGKVVSFAVETKAGQTLEYGMTGDSRLEPQGVSAVLVWGLSSIRDAVGNRLRVGYIKDPAGEYFNPDRIDYTKNPNASLDNFAQVKFDYEDRPDTDEKYLAGIKTSVPKRLKTIKTFVLGALVREYRLSYGIGARTGRSRLIKVDECDAYNKCKASTIFDWEHNDLGFLQPEQWMSNFPVTDVRPYSYEGRHTSMVDVNGDGLVDRVWTPDGRNDLWVALSTGTGFATPEQWMPNFPVEGVRPYSFVGRHTTTADINADGLADRIWVPDGRNDLWVALSTGTGFATPEQWLPNFPVPDVRPYSYEGRHTSIADVNGDGLPDRVWVPDRRNDLWVTLSTGSGFTTPEQWMPNFPVEGVRPYSYLGRHTSMVDVNGDGLTDRIWVPEGRNDLWVALSTGTGFAIPEQWMSNFPVEDVRPYSHFGRHTSIADVNGDGLADRIWVPEGRNDLWVALSTGTGFAIPEQWMPNFPIEGVRPYSFEGRHTRVADVNGDGLADRIWVPDGRNDLWVALSTGTGFATPEQWMPNFPVDDVRPYSFEGRHTQLADVNGDGLPDRVWVPDSRNDLWVSLTKSAPTDKLQTITDGLGNRTDIHYKLLTDTSIYTKASPADCSNIYPEVCIRPPIYMVSSYQATNGIGGIANYTYHYRDMRSNLLGAGMLGFAQVEKVDVQANIRTVTTLNQQGHGTVNVPNISPSYSGAYYPYLGMADSVISTYIPTNATLTAISSTYSHFGTAGNAYFSYPANGTQSKYELDGTEVTRTLTLTEYNNGNAAPFANATLVRSNITDVQNNESYITETVSTYYPDDTTNWHMGRLQASTVTHTGHGDTQIRQSSFSYNSDGLLAQTVEEPGDPVFELTTTYSYDDYGNKKAISVSGPGVSERSTHTNYVLGTVGSLERQIETTNALGHREIKTVDARFGVVIALTGPNDLTTEWEYDSFGRKIREIRPDGNETTLERQWCNNACAFGNALFRVTTETSGSTPGVEYFDILGRKIATRTVGLNGQNIYSQTIYDNKGRVEKESRPYFVGDTPVWTINEFDVLDRVKKTFAPTGTVTEFVRDELSTTVKIANPFHESGSSRTTETIKTIYADGKSRRMVDAAGDVTDFFYDALGNLTRVEAVGGITTMSYDKKGKKIGMVDPNMGHWQYQYDALGNLIYQQDANQNEVKFLYDNLNRKVLRIENEGATVWEYDTQIMGIGKLAQVTGPIPLTASEYTTLFANPDVATALSYAAAEDFAREVFYDDVGRAHRTVTYIENTAFAVDTRFDTYGRVKETTYPTNLKNERLRVANIYDGMGFLRSVRNAVNRQVYWKLGYGNGDTRGATNAQGQVLIDSVGNGLTTTRDFDPNSGRLEGVSTELASIFNVQDLSYAYDSLGNLERRSDRNQIVDGSVLNESFTYDNRYRLIAVDRNGQRTHDYAYLANGNIANKSDVGAYHYDGGSGDHGVDRIINGSGTKIGEFFYDANGNMLTSTMPNTDSRHITWTSFNKPGEIIRGESRYSFLYGPDRARYKKVGPGATKATYYVGAQNFEREVVDNVATKDTHYLYAGGTLIGTHEVHSDDQRRTHYFHKDHLGSIDVITDEFGQVPENGLNSFDAFGKRRYLDWTPSATELVNPITPRGFTGHEHLDEVGLIHMNGRVYDPTLGRFLSADPYVQYPESTQSYNRYTYVNNNPLSYTDPSGHFIGTIAAMMVSAYPILRTTTARELFTKHSWARVVGMAVATYVGGPLGSALFSAYLTDISGGSDRDVVKSFAISFASGYAFSQIGGAEWGNSGWGVLAHGVVGGVTSVATGGKFGSGFISSAFGKIVTLETADYFDNKPGNFDPGHFAVTVIAGGTGSVLGGGKFENGAISASMGYILNWFGGSTDRMFIDDLEEARREVDTMAAKELYGDPETSTENTTAENQAESLNPDVKKVVKEVTIKTGEKWITDRLKELPRKLPPPRGTIPTPKPRFPLGPSRAKQLINDAAAHRIYDDGRISGSGGSGGGFGGSEFDYNNRRWMGPAYRPNLQ